MLSLTSLRKPLYTNNALKGTTYSAKLTPYDPSF